MYGAILGDIAGSPYEFDRGGKTKDVPLFIDESHYTDDSVMTVAVAEALINAGADAGENEVKEKLVESIKKWGNLYPDAGYGGRFRVWLFGDNTEPYGSYGNGSAMRVSPTGWLYSSLERTREVARWTAEITHNHPEGVKGAESVAAIIYLSRKGYDKAYIKDYVVSEFGYDLSRTCDDIRPGYHHVESCQETVPEAITAFLEGENFVDVVKTAISLGGDCDTLTDIAAAMAEAYYGISKELISEVDKRVSDDMRKVLYKFTHLRQKIVAVKSDWSTEPMPDQQDSFTLERSFADEEISNLRKGNVPDEMEDKWFFYMKHNKLFAHRSWTGILVYVVEFDYDTNVHKVTVNRDIEQYTCQSIEEDRNNLNDLLDWWTRPQYDYYGEWLRETCKAIQRDEGGTC